MPPEPSRPDPDALLARLACEATAAGRGRLRIYFGASAGVGKTFAMLSSARRWRDDPTNAGRVALVGLVESHGRRETAALLDGLEVLPRHSHIDGECRYEEFDLDAALARRPDLILVDELAHTNAPGARHAKRWQDVDELLGAGIDVWTTLNVQHLESLNDVVGGITGIRVAETLPDAILDAADEIVIVDVTADELLERLAAGKVYAPEQAERAVRHFFRKGNLIALREIALRRVADRVEGDVQAYRASEAIERAWKTEARLLACIGPAEDAEHLVRATARLATQLNAEWHAAYVETPALQRLPDARRQAILHTLRLAETLNARIAVLAGDDPARVLARYAREHNITRLVLGRQRTPPPWRKRFVARLGAAMPEADLFSMAPPQTTPRGRAPVASRDASAPPSDVSSSDVSSYVKWPRFAWAAMIVALPALLSSVFIDVLELANVAMLFVLAVVAVAYRFGRSPAFFASVLAVLLFDFFFVPPRFSFAVSDVRYIPTFAVMLAVGLLVGSLTARLRYQARIAHAREDRAQTLYALARDLSGTLHTAQVVALGVDAVRRALVADAIAFLPDAHDRLAPAGGEALPSTLDVGIVRWSYDRGQSAGVATDTLAGSDWRYVPLRAPMRIRGVLAVRPRSQRALLIPERARLLDTLATLIAIALERVHYVEVAQRATLSIESEKLRNTLLAAVSHDLRTPLTALHGLAESLAATQPLTDRQTELAKAIRDSARAMHAMAENLLDMARFESGELRLRKVWLPIEEPIGSAIASLRSVLDGRAIVTRVAADLPWVECDPGMIERVLANLIENALKHAQPSHDDPIEVASLRVGAELEVAVLDRGPGIPRGDQRVIFEKFHRAHGESSTTGMGLGLAVCRAIVEAHGGHIRVEPRAGGGARFAFTLPIGTPPAVPSAAAIEQAST